MSSQFNPMLDEDYVAKAFTTGHLPADLAPVSEKFGELARWCVENLPDGEMRATSLRRLCEAKDRAVQAVVFAR